MVKILGFGDNVVDKYEHLKTMYPGGNSLNFTVFAKEKGAEAAYMGIFGSDDEAEHIIDTLQELNMEIFKCKQYTGENGCARVTLENGERVFLDSNEGGIRKEIVYELDRFDLEYIKSFDLVHSGNYSYTESQLEKIKKCDVKISFDFSDDSTDNYLEKVAPYVDYAFISLSDIDEEKAKSKIEFIYSLGCELVIGSRGAEGVIAYDGEKFYYQDSIPTDVVDTMGAGDALIAAFLVNYIKSLKLKNLSYSKKSCIKESLYKGALYASEICKIEGTFGYGKKY